MTLKYLLLPLIFLASSHAATFVIEAEKEPQGSVKSDTTCAGGAFVVAADQAYQPVFKATLPDNLPSKVSLYVRRMGAPVQLKSVTTGKQSEIAWDWSKPGEFSWCKMGPFERSKLGESIMLIRGDAGSSISIDSVVITDETNPDLESLLPPLPPLPIQVDWTKPGQKISRDHFGLNVFSGFNPEIANHPKYLENLAYMNPGILRLHYGGMVDDATKNPSAWVDYKNQCWLKERVLAALAPMRDLPSRLILCINTWPAWMDQDKDGRLDLNQHDAYAAFCADLVKIVNAPDAGKPILWWEITNEMDDRYHKRFFEEKKPDHLNELTDIYLKSSTAMRKADPRIKTGGPATTNSYNMDFHRRFIAATAPMLDFYSMHLYVTGSRSASDSDIFAKSDSPAWPLTSVRSMLNDISPDRKIELLMDEYNINWDWKQEDKRMKDWRSAVWDAAFCVSAINAGADGTAAWNECDGAYGKTTRDHVRRPAADSFHLINSLLPGVSVPAQIDTPKSSGLRVLAVLRPDGKKALLLLNTGTRPRTLTGVTGKATMIRQEGMTAIKLENMISLPSLSLALIEAD
ncbi:MAG: hypothetical protein H8M99_01050 [Gloeobacteraceae cyanobacterium ES-bin-144]|nr:hypothetical protein [Verrucomicrobiales bacterium]